MVRSRSPRSLVLDLPILGPSLYQCVTGLEEIVNVPRGIEMRPRNLSLMKVFCLTVHWRVVSRLIRGLWGRLIGKREEGGRDGRGGNVGGKMSRRGRGKTSEREERMIEKVSGRERGEREERMIGKMSGKERGKTSE